MEKDLEFKRNFKLSAIERRKDRLKEDIAKARHVDAERGSERINEKVSLDKKHKYKLPA